MEQPHRHLRYREDWRSVATVGLTLGLILAALGGGMDARALAVLFPFQVFLCLSCCIINHNHTHLPIFSRAPVNTFFACLLSLTKGHTSSVIIVPHHLNHHVHSGGERDWSRPELAGSGWGVRRVLRYLVAATVCMARSRRHASAPRLSPPLQRSLRFEQATLILFSGLGLLINAKVFLLWLAPSWLLGTETLLAINLIQHDGCSEDNGDRRQDNGGGYDGRGARDFVGRLGNWLLFNNGYHTVHHLKPKLHWSQTAREHAAMRVRNRLREEKSILRFFLRNYVLGSRNPGKLAALTELRSGKHARPEQSLARKAAL